ncbi:NAD(P)-dependent oxidoreductase [Candidatus Poribacteria bacterium]|nr:NAD(P)-dependent oxidoreductase [Candidatus Poribacteria bacterium]
MDTLLITGGLGRIGTALCHQFKGEYRTRSFDLRPTSEADENAIGNITDIPTLVAACEGVKAIVHLAGIPGDAPFDLLLDTNIRGTYCVYEAARQAGVQRVVFASTNHVTGMWEHARVFTTPDMPVRPDSLYAVSKAAGEATARFFADRYGIASVCMRIGAFSPEDRPRGVRSLYMIASHRDFADIVRRAVESDVHFAIVNAYPGCPKAYADPSTCVSLLGATCQDNMEDWLAEYSEDERAEYAEVEWRHLSRDEMLEEWTRVPAPSKRRG